MASQNVLIFPDPHDTFVASVPKGIGELISLKFPMDGVPLALWAGSLPAKLLRFDAEHVAEVKWVTRTRIPPQRCLLGRQL